MSKKYIQELIRQGEHQKLDFKFAVNDARKIARSLVAFANTDGGKLLIGVKDNGAIAGVRSEEEIHMIQAASELYSKPTVPYTVKEWQIDGKVVLEIDVEPGSKKPYYAPNEDKKWLVYLRVNDQNRLANKVILKVWQKQKDKSGIYFEYSKNEKFLLSYLENNPNITFSKLCKFAKIKRHEAEELLANLISLNVIEPDFSSSKTITYKLGKSE
ncbi:MAG: ATP-binding protein [Salinivirgaceae bacterium]|nr:MAG: ATP-binding protein [Salinivirgaceae bacterium]